MLSNVIIIIIIIIYSKISWINKYIKGPIGGRLPVHRLVLLTIHLQISSLYINYNYVHVWLLISIYNTLFTQL